MIDVDVGCAIIRKKGKLLIAQRPPGSSLSGFWEFPGGKRKAGESIEKCLVREAYEELLVRIKPHQLLQVTEVSHTDRRLFLFFYLCDWVLGQPIARDCFDYRWVEPVQLRNYRFPPSDAGVLDELVLKRAFYVPK